MKKIDYKFNGKNFSVFLRDDVDFSVFSEIFKWEEYKSCKNKIIESKYPIIDIGAHIGLFSIYSSLFNSIVKVYAIEPEKNNLKVLEDNVNLNKLSNIKIYKAGIASDTGDKKLYISDDSINHSILESSESDNFQEIKTYSLKDFFAINKLERVSLIKMDIEGGEYGILEGLDNDDFNKIESIVLEYHELDSKDKTKKLKNSKQIQKTVENMTQIRNGEYIENLLREKGFSVQIFPSKFEKDLGFIFAINKRIK